MASNGRLIQKDETRVTESKTTVYSKKQPTHQQMAGQAEYGARPKEISIPGKKYGNNIVSGQMSRTPVNQIKGPVTTPIQQTLQPMGNYSLGHSSQEPYHGQPMQNLGIRQQSPPQSLGPQQQQLQSSSLGPRQHSPPQNLGPRQQSPSLQSLEQRQQLPPPNMMDYREFPSLRQQTPLIFGNTV